MRKLARPAVLLAAAVGLGALFAPSPEAEAETATFGPAYKFYVGGVLVGKATLTAQYDADSYRIRADASTTGAVGWFLKATFSTEAEGALARDKILPAFFRLDTLAAKKPQDVSMTYDKRGAPAEVLAEPPFDPRPWQIDPKRQTGTIDPMSAGVDAALGPLSGADICKRRFPIYDGRRRYDFVLEGKLKERERDGFPTVDCKGRFKRVAGFKPKFMAKPDYVFTVRFRMLPNGVALPIRAWADTDFGAAIAVIRK